MDVSREREMDIRQPVLNCGCPSESLFLRALCPLGAGLLFELMFLNK